MFNICSVFRTRTHLESLIAFLISFVKLNLSLFKQCPYLSSTKNSKSVSGQDTKIRFSLEPYAGDPSFNQWKDAMKMVARLPEGVPVDFRKKVWFTQQSFFNMKWIFVKRHFIQVQALSQLHVTPFVNNTVDNNDTTNALFSLLVDIINEPTFWTRS